ncbi:hypothetical protein BC351_10310 [Paenibacillus ferrarius]|uniref:Uncharacterized protein n=1 Tax=Paenibacillus ferrarius TaxID=1469647 RepID=A0A1V4H8X9_9BACL|nr:hypothetical protein [Paenibacillus ferrarius]OPH47576.1 hypothetical protein BC351_10310 [Paenibacillus ferrarius]
MNMLEKVHPYSFVSRDFYWVSEYLDGSLYPEYNYQTFEKNDFERINKGYLIRFGYIGCGYRFYYDTPTGIFNIAGNAFQFSYLVDNVEYNLSCADTFYNDVISYKSMFSDANFSSQMNVSNISEYHFGYKASFEENGVKFIFKVIMHVPLDSPAYFTFHLVSDTSLDGKLIVRKNRFRFADFEAPLEKNIGGALSWNIEI